jgi:hypothetical protein
MLEPCAARRCRRLKRQVAVVHVGIGDELAEVPDERDALRVFGAQPAT